MNRLLRLALPAGLIIAMLLALGYWNMRPDTLFAPAEEAAEIKPEIDFYVENSETIQYMADGSIHYRMTTPRVDHIRATGFSEVTSPDLLLFRGREQPWHIQSQRASINRAGSRIELIDDARVARTDAKGRNTVLSSKYLAIYPDKDYVVTRSPVRIEMASGVTTARGMEAFLKESRMLLKSEVRGQHEIR